MWFAITPKTDSYELIQSVPYWLYGKINAYRTGFLYRFRVRVYGSSGRDRGHGSTTVNRTTGRALSTQDFISSLLGSFKAETTAPIWPWGNESSQRCKKPSKVIQLTVGENTPKTLIFLAPKPVHTFVQYTAFQNSFIFFFFSSPPPSFYMGFSKSFLLF